ncbi:bactericidal permeability-increasing protein-like [Osmerus mordax]|uniref:Bactericidal permeability-increasing protein n=1 Tax=Osmerus mordax TaxID=8014 RepID=C1BIX7_OSMMO|nr:Lipopolysaccharide-binding protein precursor [Osmerus mordax]
MLPYLVFLLLSLSTHTHGENPAIKLILTDKGLQYGKHLGAGFVQDRIKNMSFADIKGRIGLVKYVLSGVSVSQCDFPEPTVDFYEGIGFKAMISGLNIRVIGKLKIKFGFIHVGGSFDLAAFNVGVTSEVRLGDNEGHLSISSETCSAEIGDVNINFHGGASSISKMVISIFKDHFKGEIQGKICPAIKQQIEDLERQLVAIAVSFQVGSDLVLDVPLSSSPLVDSASLELDFKGEFYNAKSHTDPPFQVQNFSLTRQDSYMLSLGMSEFTANSVSYSYFSTGVLVAHITDKMIPTVFPLRLNTSSFGKLIPQLPKLFPDLLMELSVSARKVPMFSFLPGEVQLGLPGMVTAFAVQNNATLTPLFKLQADSVFSGQVSISGNKVQGSAALSNFTLTLVSSEIGPFKTTDLENLLRFGIKNGVLPKLNAKLEEGVVLPSSHHIQLVNPVLKVNKGFVDFSSNVAV